MAQVRTESAAVSMARMHAGSSPKARYFELSSPEVGSIPTPPGGEGAQGMLITHIYHLEDWTGAIAQLTAE